MKRTSLYSREHAQLIELLRELRLASRCSQKEVAEALRRPQTYVSAIEVGRQGIDLLQVRELCILYGVSLPQFTTKLERRLAQAGERPRTIRPRRSDAGKTKASVKTVRKTVKRVS